MAVVIKDNLVYSDVGKIVHRLGTETYFKKAVALSGDKTEYFEEVDSVPEPPSETEPTESKESMAMRVVAMSLNSMPMTDAQALSVKPLFAEYFNWFNYVGKKLTKDMKVYHNGALYKVLQDIEKVLINQPPSIHTASLYTEINETAQGTLDDPIPYNNNMELFEGKYYSQDGKVYKCTRNTEQPVYHPLSALVGIYVELVE